MDAETLLGTLTEGFEAEVSFARGADYIDVIMQIACENKCQVTIRMPWHAIAESERLSPTAAHGTRLNSAIFLAMSCLEENHERVAILLAGLSVASKINMLTTAFAAEVETLRAEMQRDVVIS